MILSDLISETRRILLTGQREERNLLASDITSSTTTISLSRTAGPVVTGAKLSIDLEDIYVWDITGSEITFCTRGDFGSTPAAHLASTLIHVNPKFSNFDIFTAINDELNDLSSPSTGLYFISTVELTYNPSIQGYPFTDTSILDVYEVRYSVPGPSREYPLSKDYELSRDMSDEFTSTSVIFIRDAYPAHTVLVKGKFAFTPLPATLSTAISTTNLPASAYDILSIGAAYRLSIPREVKRNFEEVQGDTRRASEVPPGANLGAARAMGAYRQSRINAEAARLSQRYPTRARRYF